MNLAALWLKVHNRIEVQHPTDHLGTGFLGSYSPTLYWNLFGCGPRTSKVSWDNSQKWRRESIPATFLTTSWLLHPLIWAMCAAMLHNHRDGRGGAKHGEQGTGLEREMSACINMCILKYGSPIRMGLSPTQ